MPLRQRQEIQDLLRCPLVCSPPQPSQVGQQAIDVCALKLLGLAPHPVVCHVAHPVRPGWERFREVARAAKPHPECWSLVRALAAAR